MTDARENQHLVAQMTYRALAAIAVGFMAVAAWAGTASAATTTGPFCKAYDGYSDGSSNMTRKGTLCADYASKYPSYKGWLGRITNGAALSTQSSPCGFSLFPYDSDEPRPMLACPVGITYISAWKWTSTGWKNAEWQIFAGDRVYVAPYGNDWRWVYKGDSWYAVQVKYVALAWFTAQ